MNERIVKSVYTQFSKTELLSVIRELDIYMNESSIDSKEDMSALILKDIEGNGLPYLDDASDILFELLIVAEYIDEEGNVLGDVEEYLEKDVDLDEVDIPDWLCFSYADPRDPSCKKCNLYDKCWDARVQARPSCFGLYSKNDPECEVCIESHYCEKESVNG